MVTFLGVIIVIIVIIFPQTQGGRARLSAASFPVLFLSSLITETDYNSVADRFGDIGSRSGYNRYIGNPSLFTQLEIESTTNLFAKPNEQNDACIKSAMARKGGCEETNFIQSLINSKGEQGDDAE